MSRKVLIEQDRGFDAGSNNLQPKPAKGCFVSVAQQPLSDPLIENES